MLGRARALATVLVGGDPASAVYVGAKQRACAEVGMTPFDIRLPEDASFAQVTDTLADLNEDEAVSGVLLQLPVPDHLDGPTLAARVAPAKDIDGLTPINVGLLSLGQPGLRPCTPLGVMELLADTGTRLEGAEAGVVRPRARPPLPLAHGRPGRGLRPRRRPRRRRRAGAPRHPRIRQARRGRD